MRHRVESKRSPKAPPALPKDRWVGSTFVTGPHAYEVIWNGAKDGPDLCGEWETYADQQDAILRLRPSK